MTSKYNAFLAYENENEEHGVEEDMDRERA